MIFECQGCGWVGEVESGVTLPAAAEAHAQDHGRRHHQVFTVYLPGGASEQRALERLQRQQSAAEGQGDRRG